jgi:hypothetical protein
LSEAGYPPGLTHDLEAARPGLPRRGAAADQPDAARAALRRAGLALERGTGDDLERGHATGVDFGRQFENRDLQCS